MGSRRITIAFVLSSVVLLGLGPSVVAGEWWWPPGMTVEPPKPNTQELVTITLSGQWPDSCVPNGSAICPPVGGVVQFDPIWDYAPGTACATVITAWSRSETLEPLPAGVYDVYATLYDGATGRPMTEPTYVGSFTVHPVAHPGDMNCDGAVDFEDINPFVLALIGRAGYEARHLNCRWLNGDINGDGCVDFDDIHGFVALLCGGPGVAAYWNSGCLSAAGRDGLGCAEPDEIVLTVEGHTLRVLHRNATYNCCPDDIIISLDVQGPLLQFKEAEVLSTPCFCICCYEVRARVVSLASGTYTVEFCWYDYEMQGAQCVTQTLVIP